MQSRILENSQEECSASCSPSASTGQFMLAVIITCYNYEEFVGRAIASVLEQRDARCEIVVVDDGSADGSWDVIERSGARAYRIENVGQRAACLYGFERTTSPFVLFLDADDELKPGSIDAIIRRLDPGVAKLQFALTRVDADGRPIPRRTAAEPDFREREVLARAVLRNGVYRSPPTSGNVFRRDVCELLRSAGYDAAVDGIILFAAPFLGDVVGLCEELGRYRIHDRNLSGLGREPSPAIIAQDIERFEARMAHLRAILNEIAPRARLVDARKAFYHLEQSFYLEIASGRSPSPSALRRTLVALLKEGHPIRMKAAMSILFLTMALLPNARAKAALAYRMQAGERSSAGLLARILARPAVDRHAV